MKKYLISLLSLFLIFTLLTLENYSHHKSGFDNNGKKSNEYVSDVDVGEPMSIQNNCG